MYAWIKQIPTSNSTYPAWTGRMRMRAVIGEENRASERKVDMRTIITCPAVMLAASRKARVMGRTENLSDSTRTRNGFSHAGAPLGSRDAINFIGREDSDDRISLSQRVNPNESVKRRWLVRLKINGVRPTRFDAMRNTNRVEMNAAHPRNSRARERESCSEIVSKAMQVNHENRDGLSQTAGSMGIRMKILMSHSFSGPIWRELIAIGGSKEEKMSVNMKVCGFR